MHLEFDSDPRDRITVADEKHALATLQRNTDWTQQVLLFESDDNRNPVKRWVKSRHESAIETPVDSTEEQDFELVMGYPLPG